MITPGHCAFARAFLEWCVTRHMLTHREKNELVQSITAWEKRIQSCLGKHPFDTFTAADKVAKRNRADVDRVYEAYLCRVCQRFHVGHVRKHGTRTLRVNYRMRKRKDLSYA